MESIQDVHMKHHCRWLSVMCGLSTYTWYNYSLYVHIEISISMPYVFTPFTPSHIENAHFTGQKMLKSVKSISCASTYVVLTTIVLLYRFQQCRVCRGKIYTYNV